MQAPTDEDNLHEKNNISATAVVQRIRPGPAAEWETCLDCCWRPRVTCSKPLEHTQPTSVHMHVCVCVPQERLTRSLQCSPWTYALNPFATGFALRPGRTAPTEPLNRKAPCRFRNLGQRWTKVRRPWAGSLAGLELDLSTRTAQNTLNLDGAYIEHIITIHVVSISSAIPGTAAQNRTVSPAA